MILKILIRLKEYVLNYAFGEMIMMMTMMMKKDENKIMIAIIANENISNFAAFFLYTFCPPQNVLFTQKA